MVLAEFDSKTSYTKDVGGIRVEWIVKTAVPAKVGKREIRVMALEGLIIAKYRAGRTQDIADLRQLMANRNQDIRWAVMSGIGTDLEITDLRQSAKALGSCPYDNMGLLLALGIVEPHVRLKSEPERLGEVLEMVVGREELYPLVRYHVL